MSRNKENISLSSAQQQDGYRLSFSKQLPSDEFFTDSLLDATRVSSRIPSPSPQKPSLTKARRARTTKTTRNAQPSIQRSATTEGVISRPRNKNPQPATPSKNGTSPVYTRRHSLTDTPGSRNDLPPASPYTGISSPPSKDLTDTYQRILDEEDLAQTERELSSSDSNLSDPEPVQQPRLKQRSKSESPLKVPQSLHIPSSASTPTRSISSLHREKRLNGQAETLSEASGLSFLKEMTDQDLAAKLTPHVSDSARDRARLRGVWENQRPIAFSKALPLLISAHDSRIASQIPVPKVAAFSKALKPLPTAPLYNNQQNGHAIPRPPSQQSGTESQQSSGTSWQNGDRAQHSMPTNARLDRNFNFSTNHGFPMNRSALTEKNLEQQNRGGINTAPSLHSQSSAPSLLSDRPLNNVRVFSQSLRASNGQGSRLPQMQRATQEDKKPVPEEASQVDWVAAAADVPLPSVENSSSSERRSSIPTPASRIISPDKSRRWDNDFTGHSFQVSESPPVRQIAMVQEKVREKEIQGVAKQAVATNRLSQIRERQSQESLRSASRSPAPRAASRSIESKVTPIATEETESEIVVEPVPDTPVVIYRSSSNSASEKSTGPAILDRPGVDRSKSHDHLQRLARAMSTTPRSSPASGSGSRGVEEQFQPMIASKDSKDSKASVLQRQPETAEVADLPKQAPAPVAQTPKVVGAWTDTILPDTVKAIKHVDGKNGYVQTPHVSAGGWIDTPAPPEQRKISGVIPTIVEEISEQIPAELVAGIVKDTSGSDTIKIEASSDNKSIVPSHDEPLKVEQPKSALASILDQQKYRLISQDITTAGIEDTLNLGHDTIESLQDLLDLNDNDITTLSRLSALEDDTKPLGQSAAEAELLERLGVKLSRLQTNINDARKGISRLEHQVSHPDEPTAVIPTPQQLLDDTTCTICNQQTFQPHHHTEQLTSKHFPHASLTLPIPLLFYPRTPTQWLPRPTPFGTFALTIGAWYLVESVMCELYCRPVYTDFYVWPAEPEPEFPYVLPTMLGRWTRINRLAAGNIIVWIWGIFAGLVRAIWRVIAMSLGWSDGFAADGPRGSLPSGANIDEAVETATKLAARTATSFLHGATGIDLSMNDDEFI